MSFPIELQHGDEREFNCTTHGPYRGRTWNLAGPGMDGRPWTDPSCPTCDVDRRREVEAMQKAINDDETRKRAVRRLEAINIPVRFRGASFDSYRADTPGQKKALAVMRAYAERFADRRDKGGGLVLIGRPGTGKTHLLTALAIALADRWRPLYVDAWRIVSSIKATYSKGADETEEQAINYFVRPDLLLVDEIGATHGTDHDRALIHQVIDRRYLAMKPTIVAGNVTLQGMTDCLGERAISRLHENGGAVLTFDWDDARKALPLKRTEQAA